MYNAITIDVESKRMAGSLIDLDNFRTTYFDHDKINKISVLYPGFEITTIEKHYYKLVFESSKIEFNQKWNMRPDYASHEIYGTVLYWYILLYINNIDCIENFTKETKNKIIYPHINSIQELVRDKISRNEIDLVNYKVKDKKAPRLYKTFIYSEDEYIRNVAKNAIINNNTTITPTCTFKEYEEIFELTATNISNKYVDLTYQPLNHSSIALNIDGFTSEQSYGYDFKLVSNDANSMQRISWSAADCTFGNGMEHLLDIGDKIHITYLYPELGCTPCYSNSNILDGGIYS